jgi:hypothetical protein
MWIAFYLLGLEWCLAAAGLGLTERKLLSGPDPGPPDLAQGPPSLARRWIELGLAAQTLALVALGFGRGQLAPDTIALLAAVSGFLWFCWLGAWLRHSARGMGGDAVPLPWLPWKALLAPGQILLLGLAAWQLSLHLTPVSGPPGIPAWCSAVSIGLSAFLGGALFLIVVFWLGVLRPLPPELHLRQAGFSIAGLAATILLLLFFRAVAIYLSIYAGLAFNPISAHFFLRSLYRGAAALIYLRWMLGVILPGCIALTLFIDPSDVCVRTIRFQLIPLLLLLTLGEFLGGALVAGTGGLAL